MRTTQDGGAQEAQSSHNTQRRSRHLHKALAGIGIAGLLSVAAISPASADEGSTIATAEGVGVVELSIMEIIDLLDAGETSSEYLVTAYLDRIEAYDDELHAVISLSPDALEQARALDAERANGTLRGPLHGVPIMLKDNITTSDMPTSAGNYTMQTFQADYDSPIAASLRDAGAIILGKTNMSEFAYMSGSTVAPISVNPYNGGSPSGSSYGSAVAVASSLVPAAIGTDTNGSLHAPAGVQGLVTMRPSWGLTSNQGVVPLYEFQDVAGPMTTTVADTALLLEVMADPDPTRANNEDILEADTSNYLEALDDTALEGTRVGVPGNREDFPEHFQSALETIEAEGAILVEIEDPLQIWHDAPGRLPHPAELHDFFYTDIQRFFATTPSTIESHKMAFADPEDIFDLRDIRSDPGWTRNLSAPAWMNTPYSADIPAHQQVRIDNIPLNREIFATALEDAEIDVDVVVYNAVTVSGGDASIGGGTVTRAPWVRLGFPTIGVPSGVDDEAGRPSGIKFAALERFAEKDLIGYAYDFEQATQARYAPENYPELDELPDWNPPVAPLAPTGVEASVEGTTVTVTWDESDDETITGYEVVIGDLSIPVDADTLSVTVPDLAEGTYPVSVRAQNDIGWSEFSDSIDVIVTIEDDDDGPEEPADPVLSVTGDTVPGGTITITGTDLTAGDYTLALREGFVELGPVTVGDDGTFEVQFTLPVSTALGVHDIILLADGTEIASVEIVVTQASDDDAPSDDDPGSDDPRSDDPSDSLPETGANAELLAWLVGGSATLIAAGLALVTARKRSSTHV